MTWASLIWWTFILHRFFSCTQLSQIGSHAPVLNSNFSLFIHKVQSSKWNNNEVMIHSSQSSLNLNLELKEFVTFPSIVMSFNLVISFPTERIECMCENTVCGLTSGRCMAISGCFTLLKQLQDDKDKRRYIMRKGCLGDILHKEIICNQQTDYLVICCKTNFCNQNVTLATLQPTEKTCKWCPLRRQNLEDLNLCYYFQVLFFIIATVDVMLPVMELSFCLLFFSGGLFVKCIWYVRNV